MEKRPLLEAGKTYWIRQTGNNNEPLFLENRNFTFFIRLMRHHLPVAYDIKAYALIETEIQLVLTVKDGDIIPSQYTEKPYQPLSNLLNAYAKAINKGYGRSGSLFRVRYKRMPILSDATLADVIHQTHLLPARTGRKYTFYPYSSYTNPLFL